MTELIEARNDTKRAVVLHQPDGEMYLVEYCSLWDNEEMQLADGSTQRKDECVGTRIIGVCGPLARRDLLGDDGQLVPSAALFGRINKWEDDFTAENAAWMQSEEDAGRVTYPIGAC